MSTIDEVIANYTVADPDGLRSALLAREDEIRDQLHLAGTQFGLMPFIVSEVLATVGLGTPPTEEERVLIRQAYVNGVNEMIRQQQEGQEG